MAGEMRADVRAELRRVAKTAAAAALHYSGLRRALVAYQRKLAGGRRVLIVSYHRVVEDFTGELQRSIPGLLISRETFRRHLEEARAAGYELVSLEEALDVLAGRKPARKDLCVVTFDDGYRDVYRHAYPVLKSMGVPATIYLPAHYVGTERRFDHDRLFHLMRVMLKERVQPLYDALPPSTAALVAPVLGGQKTLSASLDAFVEWNPGGTLRAIIDGLESQLRSMGPTLPEQGDVMDWDEARRMARDGISFGAHTLGHTVLTLESPEAVQRELTEARAICERELAVPVRDFAYCNGWYSEEVIQTLKQAGYRSAVTTEDFHNVIGGDPYTLKRKVMWENFSVGVVGDYSSCLTGCQLDDVFGVLGVNHPVPGRRPQGQPRPPPTVMQEAGSPTPL